MPNQKPYPTDVSEEEWAFVAPYLALLVRQDAPQRTHDLRDIFDALCGGSCGPERRGGCSAPRLPTMGGGLPADKEVDRRRGLRSDGPRPPARGAALGPREGSGALPWAVLESPTLRSTPESGARARRLRWGEAQEGLQGPRGRRHARAPAGAARRSGRRAGPRAGVEELARSVQEATGESVELAYVDRGYAGEEASEAAEASGIRLEVVRHPGAKKGFILLPRGGGWWSAPSRGRRASGAWSRTTRGCRRRWQGCT